MNSIAFNPLSFRENNFNINDGLTITKGKHLFMAGVDLTRHTNYSINGAYSRGEFSFSGTYTGNAFADYLLGVPSSATRSFARSLFGQILSEQEAYFQDSWKLTPKITLNLGVRYELIHQPFPSPDSNSSVNPVTNTIVVGSNSQGQIDLDAQPGVEPIMVPLFSNIIVPSSKVGLGPSLLYPNDGDFGPRFGIAWQPGGGFVVRTGYGLFFVPHRGNLVDGYAGSNLPFFADQKGLPNTTPVPTYNLTNFFTPITPSNYTTNPITVYQLDPNAPTPYIQQWNLAVQKVIKGALSVEAAYVGNKATHLTFSLPTNIPLPGPGAVQSRRPNTTFAAGNLIDNTDNSNYNALQIKAETRSWHSLYALSTYTWEKGFDYQQGDSLGSPVQNPLCPYTCERAVISQPASRLTLGTVYALPFLRNRTGMVGTMLGGWDATTILTAQDGLPFTPTISTDPANTSRSKRPNRLANGALSEPTINDWFNVSAFAVPASYTFGNSGLDILRGPGLFEWDSGLFKDFRISKLGEQGRLQFRAEFFNFTNTPAFASPTTSIQSSTAGRVLSAGAPREIQFALKLYF